LCRFFGILSGLAGLTGSAADFKQFNKFRQRFGAAVDLAGAFAPAH
jgi:hypothetical protein